MSKSRSSHENLKESQDAYKPSLWRSATTHTDLELRALDLGIPVKTIHNASIMNAVGAAGLQLYRYGETISIVFFTGVAGSGNKGSVCVGGGESLG